MHAGREAAGHQHQVALDRLAVAQLDPGDAPASAGRGDRGAADDPQAGRVADRACRGTNIDHRGNGDARRLQCLRRAIGVVVRGHHHGTTPRQHAVAPQVGVRRASQHDARPIVAREHQGPLQRAGRQHQRGRAHLPQALAGAPGVGIATMLGQALRQSHHVVRIAAERRGARQQRHAAVPRQRGKRPVQPTLRRHAIDRCRRLGQQRAAQLRLLVAQDHPRPRRRGGNGGGEAGRAGAHHQHVAVRIALSVTIRVRQGWRAAQPGGGADHLLVDAMPRPGGILERLVVEPGGQQRRQDIVDRAEIEAERRGMVLALGAQPVVQFDLRGAQVRRAARSVADDRDQRRGFIRPGRQHAARAVVFERAPQQVHAVRQQRRGQRVAGAALHRSGH